MPFTLGAWILYRRVITPSTGDVFPIYFFTNRGPLLETSMPSDLPPDLMVAINAMYRVPFTVRRPDRPVKHDASQQPIFTAGGWGLFRSHQTEEDHEGRTLDFTEYTFCRERLEELDGLPCEPMTSLPGGVTASIGPDGFPVLQGLGPEHRTWA